MFYRQIMITILFGLLVLAFSCAMLVYVAWHGVQRLEPINQHLAFYEQLRQVTATLQDLVEEQQSKEASISPEEVKGLGARIAGLNAPEEALAPQTPGYLAKAKRVLRQGNPSVLEDMQTALGWIRQAEQAEVMAQHGLLREIHTDTELHFHTALTFVLVLPIIVTLLVVYFRKRIFAPLSNLMYFMDLLARQEFTSALTTHVDPLLKPLFDKYNLMVRHIQNQEHTHQEREHALESSVDQATRVLLQQQSELARVERMAAVGEVAARLAHELRNPLAGVQMTLANLRREVTEEGQQQRLELVMTELKRISELLNQFLDRSRQSPEPVKHFRLDRVIDDLFNLVRYQLPYGIHLGKRVPNGLECFLPEASLRQVVLNLLLNAAQALDDKGEILVEVTSLDNQLCIIISDNGPGFPSELLEQGIRAYASWREGGTGLGLATVRRVVRDLDGDITLSNREPHGACVKLTLPCEINHNDR